MADITTIERWLHQATATGGSCVFRADQPGGAGAFQVAASNATLACREGGLRTIWEDQGSAVVYKDLRVTTPARDETTIDLDAEDSAGGYVRFVALPRVRLYGETGEAPRLHLACRGAAPATYTLGLMLAVQRGETEPAIVRGQYATTTTTSTSLVDLSITLDLERHLLAGRPVSCRGASAVEEVVYVPGIQVIVAAWCTSGVALSKGALYGVTLSVREPS